MYKQDLVLINLQGLICHKIQPTQPSLLLLPGLLCPLVEILKVPSMGQIELFYHLLYLKPFNCV